jgi:hypothetical protein
MAESNAEGIHASKVPARPLYFYSVSTATLESGTLYNAIGEMYCGRQAVKESSDDKLLPHFGVIMCRRGVEPRLKASDIS